MRRRQLLQSLAVTAGAGWLSRFAAGATSPPAIARPFGSLVLVELKGGNDGLNTLIPYADPAYYRLRPNLAVAREQVLSLDEHLGLNPALEPLWPIWQDRQLALVLGVGYEEPNRSHFRSIDIWETGSDSHEVLNEGWVSRWMPASARGTEDLPDAVVLGNADGPVRGGGLQVISLKTPEQVVREAARLEVSDTLSADREALAHILAVRRQLRQTGSELKQYLAGFDDAALDLPKSPLGQQLKQVARMLLAGMKIPVFQVRIGSFDTHNQQRARHDRLLAQLAEALAAFRQVLLAAGLWDEVVIMSYSEFGRRVAENAARGTDHGAAAPHFVLGGRVKGGLYGEQPSLSDLRRGDLQYRVDYRQLYTTLARGWWGSSGAWQQRYPTLDFL